MTLFTKTLKLDKANPDGATGGAPPVVPAEQVPPAATPPPVEAEGDGFDDLGYPKAAAQKPPEKAGEAPKAGDPKEKAPAPEAKEDLTGYGKEPLKVEPPADAPPAVPPTPPDDFDKALEGVPVAEAKEIKAFAVENNLPAEIAKKWGEKVKANVEQQKINSTMAEKQMEHQKSVQRQSWYKELKEDKDFGGEKFDLNTTRAQKVFSEFMPSTKKALTANGSMLPPYVMRDLAKLADHLYATDKLQTGEPIVPEVAKDEDDGTDFYKT